MTFCSYSGFCLSHRIATEVTPGNSRSIPHCLKTPILTPEFPTEHGAVSLTNGISCKHFLCFQRVAHSF